MVVEIKDSITAIERKFKDFNINADVLLGDISFKHDDGIELVAYLDPTQVTLALVKELRAFNANATLGIEFIHGKTLYRENVMYIMVFKINIGCGGL